MITSTRRSFLRDATLLTAGGLLPAFPLRAETHASLSAAIEQAHIKLWTERVDKHGIILDYAGEIPTPEDCTLGKPNAIGW